MRTRESTSTCSEAMLLFAFLHSIQSYKCSRDQSFECILVQELRISRPVPPVSQDHIHLWQVLPLIHLMGTLMRIVSLCSLLRHLAILEDIPAFFYSISTYSIFHVSHGAMIFDRSVSGSDSCSAVTAMLKVYALGQRSLDAAYCQSEASLSSC